MMLFVQVILGGLATVLGYPVIYHIIWGGLTFVVLIIATVFAARRLGSKSTLFRTGIAAIADYVVQIILGFIALGLNNDAVVVVHLTNAFVLGVLVTYLISFADSAEKASASLSPQAPTVTPGTMRALSWDSQAPNQFATSPRLSNFSSP
jgi:heme A synthase